MGIDHENGLTKDQLMDIEGVPPDPDIERRRKHLIPSGEVISFLDEADEQEITNPTHPSPGKVRGYIKKYGLDIRTVNEKIITERLAELGPAEKEPDISWAPAYFQGSYRSLESGIGALFERVVRDLRAGEVDNELRRVFNLRNDLRHALNVLAATDANELKLNRFISDFSGQLHKLSKKQQP